MQKMTRLGVMLALLAGAGTLLPAHTQEGPSPGPETEVMESVDIAIEGGGPPPFPNMMPFPGMPGPGGPGGEFNIALPPPEMGSGPEDVIAFHSPGGGDLMMLKSLTDTAFSDDQLEKMYQIKTEFQDKVGTRMVEVMTMERNLRDLLTQPEFDKGKAQSIQSKINAAKADLANYKLDERMSLLAVLTPEQRKEVRRNYVKRMDFGMGGGGHHFMRRMMHHRGGKGPGCEKK